MSAPSAAIEIVGIAVGPGVEIVVACAADQEVVAEAADEIVVARATEDQVVETAAGDHVVDAILAHHEVGLAVRRRRRQVHAAAIPVGRIGATDEVVVRAERVAGEVGAVEVDALDTGLGIGAREVSCHRDGLLGAGGQGVVDHQVAGLGAAVVVAGIERGDRQDRQPVSGSIPVLGARIEIRSAAPPLVAETPSLMTSLPSPTANG